MYLRERSCKTSKTLTLSYKLAPIAVREAVSLNEIGCRNLLDKMKEFTDAQDVLVLSTCNRTEVYYSDAQDFTNAIIKLIAIQKRLYCARGNL